MNELGERLDNGRTQGSCMIDELWESWRMNAIEEVGKMGYMKLNLRNVNGWT